MTTEAYSTRQLEVFRLVESGLLSRCQGCGPILGVNGVDASGKTQFALGLADCLHGHGHQVQLVHLDDFHQPRSVRTQGQDETESYLRNAFDLHLLEEEILAPVRRGESVDKTLILLDLDSDYYTHHCHYHIDPWTITILEGVLLFREPLDRYFDYRVYLHVGFDEVLRRAEARDVPKYGRTFLDRYKVKYIPLQQRYIEECSPLERADLVIDNTDWHRPVILKDDETGGQSDGPL